MHFSKTELQHLLRAWIIVSVAFAIVLHKQENNSISFALSIAAAAITVGLGFLLHELAHKFLAQRYGCIAEFRAFDTMLMFTLLMSFMGFIFAAPGAVFIHGNINLARNGRISAVGPLVNIVLAIIFLAANILLPLNPLMQFITSYGFSINSWLALFNMLPFWNLDGSKVFAWRKSVFFSMIAVSVLLNILNYL